MELQNLRTKFLGRDFYYYKEISSTQDEIWKMIENKTVKNGSLVFADIQTKAYGTHGRIWYTDEENNIAFSFFIETNCRIENLDGMTKEIAEIFLEIFKSKYNINLKIKLPNDIYYSDKKIGGILCQSKTSNDKVKYLVIGIGINTNKENFPEDIVEIASSIKKEFGIDVDNEFLVTEFCNIFENRIMRRIGKNK